MASIAPAAQASRSHSPWQDECLIEGLLLDGAHKPFTAGVEIGTPWWQDDGLHATVLQQFIERLCKFGVPVVQQIPLAQQKSVKGIGQLPSALLHEGRGGMRGDPGNLCASRGQFHDDKDIIRHEAMPGGDLDREEISRGEHLPMSLEELRPAHARLPSLRDRLHMVAA